MDLATITDLQQLKALAYDQIAAKEQAEAALRAINQRILEVAQLSAEAVKATLPKGQEQLPLNVGQAGNKSEPTGDADGDSTTTTTTAPPSV